MLNKIIQKIFTKFTTFKANPYHPLVWINGNPKIGGFVSIGGGCINFVVNYFD